MATLFDNTMAWQKQKGHYEVWYTTWVHRASQSGFWLRYTLESPFDQNHPKYAQLWFAYFNHKNPESNFGINKIYPIDALRVESKTAGLSIGTSRFWQEGLSGSLSGLGHCVDWDLRFLPAHVTHYHLPALAYAGGGRYVDTVVFSPNVSVPLSGTVKVDDRIYHLDGEPAGQSHLWGRKHAHHWAWAHCNAFDEGEDHESAILEALTVKLKRGPWVLPSMSMASVYPKGLSDRAVMLTGVRHLPFARAHYRTGYYQLRAQSITERVDAVFQCRPEDMLCAEYEDPDGEKVYCHNTEVASCVATLYRRSHVFATWREMTCLKSKAGAAFEWGGRAPDPCVKTKHQLLSE